LKKRTHHPPKEQGSFFLKGDREGRNAALYQLKGGVVKTKMQKFVKKVPTRSVFLNPLREKGRRPQNKRRITHRLWIKKRKRKGRVGKFGKGRKYSWEKMVQLNNFFIKLRG